MKTRSFLLITGIFLILGHFSFGQLDFGPKIGMNLSKLTSNVDSVKAQMKTGFHLGLFLRIGGKLYIQPELYYASHGSVFKNDADLKWEQKIKYGTIDVPVLVGYKVFSPKVANIRLMAGPVASFVLHKKIEELFKDQAGPVETGDINGVNWGAQVGLGADVLFMTLDIRYQFGLNKIIKKVDNYSFDTKGNIWVISLGFKIL
ncbi:MAG: PorT family protein [Bacteroidetes bacterium]|nr:PorT family protein [Bacteroidota bacterium]